MKNSHLITQLIDIIIPGDHFDLHKKNQGAWTIDHIFIVLDKLDQNLDEMIESKQMKYTRLKHYNSFVYNLLCSLNFLHSAGVMHRNLKPENILVDKNFNVKICNFTDSRTVISDCVYGKNG